MTAPEQAAAEASGGVLPTAPSSPTPPAAPPAAWLSRVQELAAQEGVPPLLYDPMAESSDGGRWHLHPWTCRGDVGALLAWAEHLDGHVSVWRVGHDGGLALYGALAGFPTALIGHSHRLPAGLLALDVEALRRLVDVEAAARDPQLPPLPLTPAEQVDPLRGSTEGRSYPSLAEGVRELLAERARVAAGVAAGAEPAMSTAASGGWLDPAVLDAAGGRDG